MFFLKIICDIDGTVADLMSVVCARIAKTWGINLGFDEITDYRIKSVLTHKYPDKDFSEIDSWWNDVSMYEGLPAHSDGVTHLLLSQEMDSNILFVSARPATPAFYDVTMRWLRAQKFKKFRLALGVTSLQRVSLCMRLQPDAFYDDLDRHVKDVHERCPFTSAVLVPRPWNSKQQPWAGGDEMLRFDASR